MNSAEQDFVSNMAGIAKAGVDGFHWTELSSNPELAYIASGLSATYEAGGWSKGGGMPFGSVAVWTPSSLTVKGTIDGYGVGAKSNPTELTLSFRAWGDWLEILVNGKDPAANIHASLKSRIVYGSQTSMQYVIDFGGAMGILLVEQPSYL